MNDEEIRTTRTPESSEVRGYTQIMPEDSEAKTAAQETAAAAENSIRRAHRRETATPVRRKKRRSVRKMAKLLRQLLVVLVIVLAGLAIKHVLDTRTSASYTLLSSSEREGSSQASYMSFDGAILHYSSDGASLGSADGTQVWNETYEMDTPVADASDSAVVIYDQKGTGMCVFDSRGLLGTITTELPILKARVSSQGMIAAILEDGDTTWINFYSAAGETIATGKTRIDSPGYPVDLDVSPNGELLVVSYVYVDGTTPTSYVAFYNFGTTGQNQMDNMVSGYTYADVLVPQVRFLASDTAVAIRDDGMTLYKGTQIPAESLSVGEEEEIVSCFADDAAIGLVTADTEENSDTPYRMKLYDLKGKLIADRGFQAEYTTIRVDSGCILMYNDKQLSVFTMSGQEKFHGTIEEGTIQDVCTISKNRFLVVMNESVATIKIR
ncbi:MAG: DUF5711 family protein [Lachnospiraceae bacterium]